MSVQHEHQSDEAQGDAQGHLYIPKDERAGAGQDTEGHKRYRGRLDDPEEGDLANDAEGHVADTPTDAVNEPAAVRGRDGKGHR